MAFAQPQAPAPPPRLFPATQAWQLPLNTDLAAPPAMSGKLGYFPLAGDRLAAYDIEFGTLLWLVPATTALQPAVGGDLVFVVEPASLTAFYQHTGSVAWRVPFSEPLAVPLVFDNGWLVAATQSGTVLAFRGNDGGLIWRREIEGGVQARPALAADRVYISARRSKIVALRVETGEVLWERAIGGVPNEILALDRRIYVGSDDNYLYALDAATGEKAWRWSTGGDVVGAPVADDRKVYFVSYDNVLRALDRNSGSQRWKRALPLRPTRGVVRAGDAVIVSGLSRNALAFSLKDGSPAGDMPGGGELASLPYVLETAASPMLIMVTQDFAEGTVVRALKRSWEPTSGPLGGPLPNVVAVPKPAGSSDATTPDSATQEKPPSSVAPSAPSAPAAPAARPPGSTPPGH